jgi:hypothetical protein
MPKRLFISDRKVVRTEPHDVFLEIRENCIRATTVSKGSIDIHGIVGIFTEFLEIRLHGTDRHLACREIPIANYAVEYLLSDTIVPACAWCNIHGDYPDRLAMSQPCFRERFIRLDISRPTCNRYDKRGAAVEAAASTEVMTLVLVWVEMGAAPDTGNDGKS